MRRHNKSAILFLLPGLIGLAAFYGAPFAGGIWYSLTDGTFQNNFAGIDNYKNVLTNEMFRLGLVNTLTMSLICAPLIWALAFWVSSMLRGMKNATFFRNALLMPYLMPSSAILFIWLIAFDYGGPLNRIIAALGGGRVLWLASGALRAPIVLMYIWKNLGFMVIIYTAALQAVPEAYYEYAELEGAAAFTRWRHVTLPLIAPTAYLVFVFAWINAFRIFKETYFIGGAYPDMSVYTLQHYMNNMFAKLNYQNVTTAAYSFALLVIALFAALYGLMARARRGM